jgi:hypothetical protein
MSQFLTVFDLADAGYKTWWLPASGLLIFAFGVIMAFGVEHPFFPMILVSSSAWVIGVFYCTYSHHLNLRKRQKDGTFDVVEGPIENFSGPKDESFDVHGTHFAYAPSSLVAGFNTPAYDGGPMKPDLHVRISHVNGEIIRLEIRR